MFINTVKTFLLLAGLSALLVLLGGLTAGSLGIHIAIGISLMINVVTYFYSDTIVLKLYRAQPMNSQQYTWVYGTTQELSRKMNIPTPKLWLINTPMANAFATGRNPANGSVALTTGILQKLEKDELFKRNDLCIKSDL